MIGYHYTSLENYQQICRAGLALRPLREEIACHGYTHGIWLYLHRQERLSHLACVAYQALKKNTKEVVLLKVRYDEDDRWTPDGKHVLSISHTLFDEHPTVVNFHRQEAVTILFKPVPPERIRLLCTTHVDDLRNFVEELRKAA